MIYLASPYNHEKRSVMEQRFRAAADVTTKLIEKGTVVFSPIVHNHYLAVNYDLPRDFDFWMAYDLPMLDLAEELYVLALVGWHTSKGVATEINHAKSRNIPISFVNSLGVVYGSYNSDGGN